MLQSREGRNVSTSGVGLGLHATGGTFDMHSSESLKVVGGDVIGKKDESSTTCLANEIKARQ